jgi:hypothetical protein
VVAAYFISEQHRHNYTNLTGLRRSDDALAYMVAHPVLYTALTSNQLEELLESTQMRSWIEVAQAVAGRKAYLQLRNILRLDHELYQAVLQVFEMMRRDLQ